MRKFSWKSLKDPWSWLTFMCMARSLKLLFDRQPQSQRNCSHTTNLLGTLEAARDHSALSAWGHHAEHLGARDRALCSLVPAASYLGLAGFAAALLRYIALGVRARAFPVITCVLQVLRNVIFSSAGCTSRHNNRAALRM